VIESRCSARPGKSGNPAGGLLVEVVVSLGACWVLCDLFVSPESHPDGFKSVFCGISGVGNAGLWVDIWVENAGFESHLSFGSPVFGCGKPASALKDEVVVDVLPAFCVGVR